MEDVEDVEDVGVVDVVEAVYRSFTNLFHSFWVFSKTALQLPHLPFTREMAFTTSIIWKFCSKSWMVVDYRMRCSKKGCWIGQFPEES